MNKNIIEVRKNYFEENENDVNIECDLLNGNVENEIKTLFNIDIKEFEYLDCERDVVCDCCILHKHLIRDNEDNLYLSKTFVPLTDPDQYVDFERNVEFTLVTVSEAIYNELKSLRDLSKRFKELQNKLFYENLDDNSNRSMTIETSYCDIVELYEGEHVIAAINVESDIFIIEGIIFLSLGLLVDIDGDSSNLTDIAGYDAIKYIRPATEDEIKNVLNKFDRENAYIFSDCIEIAEEYIKNHSEEDILPIKYGKVKNKEELINLLNKED